MKIDYHNTNIKGMALMALNVISLAMLYATMKGATQTLNSNQATFLYKVIILLLILPWIFYKDGFNAIKTPNLKLHLLRSIFSTAGSLCMMYTLKYLKLLDVTALTHLEQILWIIIGAVFFDERISTAKIIAVLLGFIGGFIIVKPEFFHNLFVNNPIDTEFHSTYFFVFLTIACWCVNSSLVKLLGHRKASNKAQLFYVMLFASLFSYGVAFIEWQYYPMGAISLPYPEQFLSCFSMDISWWHIKYIAVASAFYLIHNIAFFNAMKYGEMTVIAPLAYLKLACAGLLGYLIFGESPKMAISYVGYSLIIIAGLITIHSEYQKCRSQKAIATDNI